MPEIAGEKAGIIKPNVPVVIGEYTPETKPVFLAKASETGSAIHFASESDFPEYESDLKGDYQKQNRKTVLQTLRVLSDILPITENNIREGMLHVNRNTGFKGRWQQIHSNPTAIADTAHNSHGLKLVMQQLGKQQFKTLRMVLGVVNDKDLQDILPILRPMPLKKSLRPTSRTAKSSVQKRKAF